MQKRPGAIVLKAVERDKHGSLMKNPYKKGFHRIYACGERSQIYSEIPFVCQKTRLPREADYRLH